LGDLDASECASQYKNAFEGNLKLTKDGLIMFYDEVMRKFSKVTAKDQNTHAKVNVKIVAAGVGLHRHLPCVLQQFKFTNHGKFYE